MQELPALPKDRPQLPKLPKLGPLPKLPKLSDVRVQPQDTTPEPPIDLPALAPDDPKEDGTFASRNFGWITNLPTSTIKLVKSLVWDLPKAALTSAVNYTKNPSQYAKDLNLLFSKNNGLGHMLKEEFVDPYSSVPRVWKTFNDDPARVLNDIATIVTLGASGAAQFGKVGKAATILSRAEQVGKVGLMSERALQAGRIGQRIKAVGEVGNYMDPMVWVGKGVGKAAKPILTALGFGEHTPNLAGIDATAGAVRAGKMVDELNTVIYNKLKPYESAYLERLNRWGWQHELDALNDATVVGKRHKLWRELVTGGDESLFKDLRTLDDAVANEAKVTKAHEYAQFHWKELGFDAAPSRAEVQALFDAKKINPTFMSSYRMKQDGLNIFEALNKGEYRGGAWSRFENAKGGMDVLRDQDAVMARMIAQKHDNLYKLELYRSVMQYLAERGLIFVKQKGDMTPIPKDYAPFQGAFHEKYWKDMGIANQVQADAVARGANAADTIKAIVDNPQIMQAIADGGEIYVPQHVAAWLNKRLAPISAVGQLYDKGMSHLKPWLTLLNPKYWGSVIFGNSTMGALAGASPDVARVMWRNRASAPAEMKNLANAEVWLREMGVYGKTINFLGDWAQRLDAVFRNPIFASELGKNAYVRMKYAGGNMVLTTEQLTKALQYFGPAPERLLQARLQIAQLSDQIAVRSGQLLELQRQERTAGRAMARNAARDGREIKSAPGYDELGRKIEGETPTYYDQGGKPVVARPQETPYDAATGRDIPQNEGKGVLDPDFVDQPVTYKFIPESLIESKVTTTDWQTGASTVKQLSKAEKLEVIKQFTLLADDMKLLAELSQKVRANPTMVIHPQDLGFKITRSGDGLVGRSGSEAGRGLAEIGRDLKRQFQDLTQGYSEQEKLRKAVLELVRYKAQRKQPLPGVTQPFDFGGSAVLERPHEVYPDSAGEGPRLGPVDTTVDPITGARLEVLEDGTFRTMGQEPKPLSPTQAKMVEIARLTGNIGEDIKSLKEDLVHKLAEAGELQRRIPRLAADAEIADRAIEAGNRFFGSYARLSPFERRVLRRVLPFYTFNKAMTMLAFRAPFLYPKRVFIGSHLAQMWNEMMSDDDAYIHPSLRNYVPVAARPDGSVVAISASFLNPLAGVRMGQLGETPLPNAFNPLTSHPVISLVLKMNGAIPEWSGKPLSPGDYSTRLDNGAVVQWTGKGFKTVVAQPNVFKSLFDLFPQAQLINRLFHPYAQSDRGWLFSPDPILGPDKQPRYPKELMERIWSMVIPTAIYDPVQMKATELGKMQATMRSYMKDIRTASPVRREQILEILRAWRDEKNRRWIQ